LVQEKQEDEGVCNSEGGEDLTSRHAAPERPGWKIIKCDDTKWWKRKRSSRRVQNEEDSAPRYIPQWEEMIGPMQSLIQSLRKALGPKAFKRNREQVGIRNQALDNLVRLITSPASVKTGSKIRLSS
jgi:hypothetical protein